MPAQGLALGLLFKYFIDDWMFKVGGERKAGGFLKFLQANGLDELEKRGGEGTGQIIPVEPLEGGGQGGFVVEEIDKDKEGEGLGV